MILLIWPLSVLVQNTVISNFCICYSHSLHISFFSGWTIYKVWAYNIYILYPFSFNLIHLIFILNIIINVIFSHQCLYWYFCSHLVARILSLVDSLESAHDSIPECSNVDNRLSYALYIWKSVLLVMKSLRHLSCHWDCQIYSFFFLA